MKRSKETSEENGEYCIRRKGWEFVRVKPASAPAAQASIQKRRQSGEQGEDDLRSRVQRERKKQSSKHGSKSLQLDDQITQSLLRR